MLPVVFMLLVDQMMAVVLILQVEPMKVDKVFHEELNDVDGDNNESDWVDGDNLLSDDDDEEMVAIKNKFKLVEDLGPDVVLEESVHVSIEENEDLKGLGGGEETDYLDSSDAGSYETNSDGGIICKKSGKIVEMQKLGREELKVELQKHTCIKARKWALEKIRGSVVLEFNRLFDYVFALRSVDPNGTFELMVERPTEVEKPKFRRLYVCFGALKEGFKKFCRPIISLDGCYLKGSFKGEILSVVGRDGNNQIFPIAWALVEMENRDTWTWFLQNIQKDMNLGDGSNFTLISDTQKAYLKRFINAYQMWSTDFVLGICMPIGRNCTKVQTESAQTKFAQPATTSSPPTQPMPTSPQTQPLVVSIPSRYNVTAHGPRGRTIMQGLGVYTNEETKLQILNPGRPSQVLFSRPHIRSNLMASTTSQPIISQSHYTSSHPTVASSRHSTTVSKP
ncbi:hypothetical protein V6N13_111964 [Hibiscus sabdariffa]